MRSIDPSRQIYPYCIVWTPIPCISWLFPFIGHTGIGDSQGVLYDFAGPYSIGKGNLAFGAPTRYLELNPSLCREFDWDRGIQEGCAIYCKRMHNLCYDNCHSHVAKCLNLMGYNNKVHRNMFSIGVMMFFSGRFVGLYEFFATYFPFSIIFVILYLAGNGFFSR